MNEPRCSAQPHHDEYCFAKERGAWPTCKACCASSIRACRDIDNSLRKLPSSVLGTALCSIILAQSSAAHARARGIVASSCDGCHGSSDAAELSLSASPTTFEPGARVTFALGIRSSALEVAGTSLSANAGTLSPINGEGLVAATDALIHDAPKPGTGGEVTFRFAWQAPDQPGAVTFVVAAVAGNGDGGWGLRLSGETAAPERA